VRASRSNRWSRATVLALGLVLWSVTVVGLAAAQPAPPSPKPAASVRPILGGPSLNAPPSQRQQSSTAASNGEVPQTPVTFSTNADAVSAAHTLAQETYALAVLGAFGTPPTQEIATAVADVGPASASHDDVVSELDVADKAGAVALSTLEGDGLQLSLEVRDALAVLSPADRSVALGGGKISLIDQTYLLALEDLLVRNGAHPESPAPPDAAGIASALASSSGSTVGGRGSHGPSASFLLILAIVFVLAVAVVVTAIRLAGRRTSTIAPHVVTASPMAARVVPGIRDVLEVSRRLTAAAGSGQVERAVVREAMGLAPATAAALFTGDQQALTAVYETQPGLLSTERVAARPVARAARTLQPQTDVLETEHGAARLPMALAAIPLADAGRVEGVVVLARAPHAPFTLDERDRLMALAPIAAAAMQSARSASAAVERSLTDPLTGVGNRRRMDDELAALFGSTGGGTAQSPIALVMVDLDHFKSVNDSFGHQTGDELLRGVAEVLRQNVRPGDGVYRYGGEEFCVVMPATTAEDAAAVAERIRAAVAESEFGAGPVRSLRATASLGVASTEGASLTGEDDAASLVARADAALYRAKESGRDQVVVAA
jgi:diguanylate cyclase (GGDEF)-like protein